METTFISMGMCFSNMVLSKLRGGLMKNEETRTMRTGEDPGESPGDTNTSKVCPLLQN